MVTDNRSEYIDQLTAIRTFLVSTSLRDHKFWGYDKRAQPLCLRSILVCAWDVCSSDLVERFTGYDATKCLEPQVDSEGMLS